MQFWTIVPKGTGALMQRVGLKPDAKEAISLVLFTHPTQAKKQHMSMPVPDRLRSEVVAVEFNLK